MNYVKSKDISAFLSLTFCPNITLRALPPSVRQTIIPNSTQTKVQQLLGALGEAPDYRRCPSLQLHTVM